jgi:hypothetical protein
MQLAPSGSGSLIEVSRATSETPSEQWKGRPMWIYDGDQWIEEGVSETDKKRPETIMPRHGEELYPDLQVVEVEILPVPQTNYVPHFPHH